MSIQSRTAKDSRVTTRKLKDLFEGNAEGRGNTKRDFERRRVFAELDRVDRLARHADPIGERLLRHLVVFEAQTADVIGNREA